MQKIYKIDAVHSILKRIIKSNLNEVKMNTLYKELCDAGYEKQNIILTTIKTIYEVGDIISIPKNMIEALPTKISPKEKKLSIQGKKEYKNKLLNLDLRSILGYVYNNNLPTIITGIIKCERINRNTINLMVEWHESKDEYIKKSPVYYLEALGFEFIYPDFDEIPIFECDDEILDDNERVIKYLMIESKISEEEAWHYLKPIQNALNKAGMVFYRP